MRFGGEMKSFFAVSGCALKISLLTSVLDVANLMSSEQKVTRLLHVESVVLEYLAGKDNVFYKR